MGEYIMVGCDHHGNSSLLMTAVDREEPERRSFPDTDTTGHRPEVQVPVSWSSRYTSQTISTLRSMRISFMLTPWQPIRRLWWSTPGLWNNL